MTRHPYGPDELDRVDAELDRVANRLERYAAERRPDPPLDLATRIRDAIDAEPDPRGGWWSSVTAGMRAWPTPARVLAVAAVMLVAVVGALALGELAGRARRDDVGSSPVPSVVISLTPTPSPSPTPSPTPSPSPSPSPTEQPSATPSPTASDDDDEVETPEPNESDDSSGPGGGDDGGSDDNSGPGGG